MHKLCIAPMVLLLAGCGMSQGEKETLAQLTCNIMGESRNMDAAFRIKEINSARDKMGEPAYLGSDERIKTSFALGLCEDLVLSDEIFEEKLAMKLAEEREKERQLKAEMQVKKERERAEAARNLEEYELAVQNHVEEFLDQGLIPETGDLSWFFITFTGHLQLGYTCIPSTAGIIRAVLSENLGEIDFRFSCSNEKPADGLPSKTAFQSVTERGVPTQLGAVRLSEKGKAFFQEKGVMMESQLTDEHYKMLEGLIESAETIIKSSQSSENYPAIASSNWSNLVLDSRSEIMTIKMNVP